ncbi:Integrin alpha-8 [Melipona quadrifasciata]|uniref:Integrin alpha-8 n=1 Tax=Melipona quadrifasciata TaxID=166423 RepID=A0A0N1ITN4_9HYME|nr:Integrin alpha-8 [Melipona quadrifasciata]
MMSLWYTDIKYFLPYNVLAYNLNIDNAKVFNIPKVFNHQRGSYFGFSIALYTDGQDSVLLVSAPRANTSIIENVIEPGTVFQCPINEACKEWIIDRRNDNYKQYSTINQIKDNAWIGATIAVENKTNPKIVVCAPRLKNNVINKNVSNWFMNGICYLSLMNSTKSFEKETKTNILSFAKVQEAIYTYGKTNIYNFGMSQVGFSMHMTSNDLKWDLILGSPGVFNWKGTPLLVTKSIHDKTQTVIPSIKNEKNIHTNSYFGYAVTSGYFIKGKLWFASGAPRASNMYGAAIIFTFSHSDNAKLEVKKLLIGEQHGEYFGAALSSCNLNGDDKDELIVGAPHWSKNIDEGRIYIFTALNDEIFEKQSFEGKISGSRFGSIITCLGDVDYDGYGDIAVGAPYEEESGAIYIFNGNSNGLPKLYSQRIIGKQFGRNIRGFGISISEPRDINSDKYPDIAVGAYLSEQAVLIKSKPVIIITTKLAHDENKKLLKNSTSFLINLCARYDGINAPKYLRIVKSLKIDQIYRRAHYNTEKNNDNIYKLPDTLYKSKNLCNEFEIHLKENIQNVINPIEISVSINLEKDWNSNDSQIKSNAFCTSCVAVNKLLSKTEDSIKLPFAVDCGDDNICTSDVKILLSSDLNSGNRYIIGSTFTTELKIDVLNYGEPAYQAKIYIYIPKTLSLGSISSSCMESFYMDSTLEVICDVGNPLLKNKTLTLDLDMNKIRSTVDHVKLWANFDTQSEQKNSFNNTDVLIIYFDVDVDIVIAGKAQDNLYSYSLEDENRKLNSIQFQHIYEIQKFGVSPIDEVILTISVPIYWKHNIEDIQIININEIISNLNGQPFYCAYENSTASTTLINKSEIYSTNTELYTQKEFRMNTNFSINFPPDNRSIYINCTNINVKCTYIICQLGPFISSSSVAKLSLTLDFYLSHFKSKITERKDIIFFLSSGKVNILESHHVIQKIKHKSNNTVIATMFLGSPVAQHIATWIIVLSIVLGILLLILLILVLIKIGFFNRNKKKELEALKSETNTHHGITLKTCSSTDIIHEE